MKTDQIIAELFALLRLLIDRTTDADLAERMARLEQWKADTERVWPQIKER